MLMVLLSVPVSVAFALPQIIPQECLQDGDACQLYHLIELINNVVRFFIAFGVLFAVVMIAINGFKLALSRGNASAMEQAKSKLLNILIGFAVILLAYLIISTIMSVLTGKSLGEWSAEFKRVDQKPLRSSSNTNNNTTVVNAAPTPSGLLSASAVSGNTSTEIDGRAVLANAGISVNKNCNGGSTGTCLQGMNQSTIAAVVALNKDCGGCVSAVTGGTETGVGHECSGQYSHCNGYKVDLRTNVELSTYIYANYDPCGSRGGYCDSLGNEYVREDPLSDNDHWDVTVKYISSSS